MTPAILWTAAEAAAATGGHSSATWGATGVSIDSRTLVPGDLFVAIKGPNFDGHDFVGAALKRGAAAALVSRRPDDLSGGIPLLTVDDTMTALEDLGHAARHRTRARIVAITGSVGKTSTKEALAACLSAQGSTFASKGSLNNHWGVPLSLARMDRNAAFGVFEIGMNHAGEIRSLSRQIRPHFGLITTVAAAHLEFFPSVEAIADAKAEIFEGMEADGTAFLNRDNPHFARLLAAVRTQGLRRIVTFGTDPDADARLVSVRSDGEGSSVVAEIAGTRHAYHLALPGPHQALNSVAVLAIVAGLGLDVALACETLAGVVPVPGRGSRETIDISGGQITMIDESYNASPEAVRAAISTLATANPERGGRRIAVLGDMLELGETASVLHAGLTDALIAADIDLILTAGPLMQHLHDALPADRRGGHWQDTAAMAADIGSSIRAGDVVLVKGSLGVKMAHVVQALRALRETSAGTGGR